MNIGNTYRRYFTASIILTCCITVISLQSCKKKRSDIANALYGKTQNKVFKKLDPQAFADVFKQVLSDEKSKLSYGNVLDSFYTDNDYDPVLVMHNLRNDNLKVLASDLNKAGEHGLDSGMFAAAQYNSLLAKFYDKKAIKTTDETYHDLAELELMTANSLIKYSNALRYGIVNPKQIFKHYDIETKGPDSNSYKQVFKINDMRAYLDSIQPRDPQYVALQKALINHTPIDGLSPEECKRVLMVNLERLRWQNKPKANKYVLVNIPDFHLDVMENGQSVLGMKVCVGKGRNMDYQKTLINYVDTDKTDHPTHETPMLNSLIYEAQVNPVWNIPESIANKEIIVQAKADPYYLSNNNIDVYKDGQKVDEDNIDWSTANASDYSFKQEPGEDNSLGKIKFLFKNKRSVYLHDTPVKNAFNNDMRAVSHGCVRVEKPLDLAQALFGDGAKYNLIEKDYQSDNSQPTDIALPAKVPVYIIYKTCWADNSGALQYRKDVYGLDIILYVNLLKNMKGGTD